MSYKIAPLDWGLMACLVVFWGSSFVMSKIALKHIDPSWIAASRLWIGALILALWTILQRAEIPRDRKHLKAYAWLGLVGDAAPFVLITWGMQFISSGIAGLLMGTIPLIVLVMAHFTLPGERLNMQRGIGFMLGFAGLVVLIGPDKLSDVKANGPELLGQLAVVGGCLLYGINSVSTKRMNLRGTVAVSTGVLLAAALIATAWALTQAPFTVLQQPNSALWALLGLGAVPTGLATVVWFKAVERTGPTFIVMTNYLVPIYALVFGAIILGESLHWNVVIALGLILSGIFISRVNLRNKFKPLLWQ